MFKSDKLKKQLKNGKISQEEYIKEMGKIYRKYNLI